MYGAWIRLDRSRGALRAAVALPSMNASSFFSFAGSADPSSPQVAYYFPARSRFNR